MIKGGSNPLGEELEDGVRIEDEVRLAKVYESTEQMYGGPGRPGPGVRPDIGRSVNSMHAKLRIQCRLSESCAELRGLPALSLPSPLAAPCYFSCKRQIGKHNSDFWSC